MTTDPETQKLPSQDAAECDFYTNTTPRNIFDILLHLFDVWGAAFLEEIGSRHLKILCFFKMCFSNYKNINQWMQGFVFVHNSWLDRQVGITSVSH